MRTGFGEELVAGIHELLKQRGDGELGEVALKNDVVAMLFSKPLREIGDRASEFCLSCWIRRGHFILANCCVAEQHGHILLRAVEVLVVDGERQKVPLRENRRTVPEEEDLGQGQSEATRVVDVAAAGCCDLFWH